MSLLSAATTPKAILFLGGWRATIFFAGCVALAATTVVQSSRLSSMTNKRDDLHDQSLIWEQANASNVKAIADLTSANDAWATAARDGQSKAANAVAAVAAERDRLAAELSKSRRDRQEIYRDEPDAAAWSRAVVPSRIADQLRQ